MKREWTAQVGADGVLTLSVPLGREDANKTVRVVVETLDWPTAPITDPEEWHRFLDQIAGSITDPTFERPPQGEYEERDPL